MSIRRLRANKFRYSQNVDTHDLLVEIANRLRAKNPKLSVEESYKLANQLLSSKDEAIRDQMIREHLNTMPEDNDAKVYDEDHPSTAEEVVNEGYLIPGRGLGVPDRDLPKNVKTGFDKMSANAVQEDHDRRLTILEKAFSRRGW